ncbi:hypothetical protein MNBD_GAMMA01-1998, partial [hydrothermal vent metagenome]
YKIMIISIPDDDNLVHTVVTKNLPKQWHSLSAYSLLQNIGSQWYQKKQSLILKVPSVIIPQEYNYMINTKHDNFSRDVKLIRTEDYFWDYRLL